MSAKSNNKFRKIIKNYTELYFLNKFIETSQGFVLCIAFYKRKFEEGPKLFCLAPEENMFWGI